MTAALTPIDPQRLMAEGVLELRGDGKAGGGLVLAFQSLGSLLLADPELHVQEWPFFSSARRGAGIRSFLRVSRKPIQAACEVTRPSLVLLMNEGVARSVDFADGVPRGGTFVINTRREPEECARHYRLSGRVLTVPGDEIGQEHLKAPLGNVSAYIAVAHAIGGFRHETVIESFLAMLRKRRIPDSIVEKNRAALEASLASVRSGVFDFAGAGERAGAVFEGYGDLPIGAQTALRLSQSNRTADYAPSGFRLRFEDPTLRCTGCAHCITNCPEGIIHFVPDPEKGLQVTHVDVSQYCKLCGECIATCPEQLFKQVPFEETWEEVTAS